MKSLVSLSVAAALASCATTTYSNEPASTVPYGEPGTVTSVRDVVRRVQGHPGAGAAAGGLIGGLVTGRWIGAAVGAATGAIVSSGSYATRAAEVIVQFDDGQQGVFTFRDYTMLRPGQRVELTPNGPMPAG
ncbi:MAG TPA: hypothetical protein VGF94_08385 [Kofleriaceae bacterium]